MNHGKTVAQYHLITSARCGQDMPNKITAMMRRALAVAMITLFMASAAFPQNGKLVDATLVTLDEHALKRLEVVEPSIRELLREVEIKSITYLSDGLKVKGYLAVPKKGERLPSVIFNRGGNRSFGALNDTMAANLLGKMAHWGYVVVASQYRGNSGGEGQEEFGGAEVNDILNLVPLLESLPQADGSRIGMYGWSRGGMMTYLALTKTDRVAAAIVGAGMADSFDTITRRPDMAQVYAELVPNYLTDKETALTARSAIYWPEKLHKTTPILLLHGSSDWRVHPTQALRMAAALYETKHPFRLVFLEGGDHGLSEHREEVNRLVKNWLDRYVRDRKPWPSLEPHGR